MPYTPHRIIVNSSVSFQELFLPNVIVNHEQDVFIQPASPVDWGGTPILITSLDLGNRTMVVDYFPPIEGTEDVTDWIVAQSQGTEPSRSGQDQAYGKITSFTRGSGTTGTITWSATINRQMNVLSVGEPVYFANLLRTWDYNLGSNTFKISNDQAWCPNSLSQGGFWTTQNGDIRLLITGGDSTPTAPQVRFNIGYAYPAGNDLTSTWSLTTTAKVTYLNYPSWCSTTGFAATSIIRDPVNATKWIAFGSTYDTVRRLGWFRFDDNLENIEFSTSYINMPASTYGYYTPSVYYDSDTSTFIMTAVNMNGATSPDTGEWETEIFHATDPLDLNGWTWEQTMSSPNPRNIKECYANSHSSSIDMFEFNGQLVGFHDGTARYNAAGNRGQRNIGFAYRSSGVWYPYDAGVVYMGYQFANLIWDRPYGHTGGNTAMIVNNGYLYAATALTQATDSYKIILSRILIPTASYCWTTKGLYKYTGGVGEWEEFPVYTYIGLEWTPEPLKVYLPCTTTTTTSTTAVPTTTTTTTVAGTTTTTTTGASTGLLTNLLSIWEMDETTGTTIYDGHGSNNLTLSGGLLEQTPPSGLPGAITVGATGRMLSGLNIISNYNSNSFSIWFKTSVTANGAYHTIFSSEGAYTFYVFSNLDYAQGGFGGSLSGRPNLGTGWADGNWHHIVMTNNNVTTYVYFDGDTTPISYSETSYNIDSLSRATCIGASYLGNTNYCGVATFAQCAIWPNRVLSQSDVTTLYNGGAGLPYSSW